MSNEKAVMVPFYTENDDLVCELAMDSIPALDMSFEYNKKFYKVIAVKSAGEPTELEYMACVVKQVGKDKL